MLNTDKTKLAWTDTRHNLSFLGVCDPSLHLGGDVINRAVMFDFLV